MLELVGQPPLYLFTLLQLVIDIIKYKIHINFNFIIMPFAFEDVLKI